MGKRSRHKSKQSKTAVKVTKQKHRVIIEFAL